MNYNRSNFDLTSEGIENIVDEWLQTKEQSIDQSMDIDGRVEEEEMLSTKRSEQGNLYECNVEQGNLYECNVEQGNLYECNVKQGNLYECNVEHCCTAVFVKFGNLINHILVGKHRRVIEKLSLKDTAMKMYHSKLEEIENQ